MEQQPASRSLGNAVLRKLVRKIDCGLLKIHTPTGDCLVLAGDRPGPQVELTIHRWRCLWRLFTGWDIGFAESYMAGDWSTPNLFALLTLMCRNSWASEAIRVSCPPRAWHSLRHALNRNTRRGSRRNIAAHYDLGNAFYAQWLDAGMTYSSALYSAPSKTLEAAQRAKLDRVVDLLALSGGQEVLEIGCGWGSLAERMIAEHGCAVTGLTLSSEQLAYAQNWLRQRGLFEQSDLRLQDYRDARGTYDRIVSIEMLEAVGEAYWPRFFGQLSQLLRPQGIAVLQVITIDESRFEIYRGEPDFIQRYIFPGGMLPTPSIVEREAARAGLQVVSAEFFGESYGRTLAEWQRRFQEAWPAIQALGFDMQFKRLWEYYLDYCRAGFEAGMLNVGLYKISHA